MRPRTPGAGTSSSPSRSSTRSRGRSFTRSASTRPSSSSRSRMSVRPGRGRGRRPSTSRATDRSTGSSARFSRAYRFAPGWDDADGDARRWLRDGGRAPGLEVEAVDLARPVFFRGRRLSRGTGGDGRREPAACPRSDESCGKIVVDALLLDEDEVERRVQLRALLLLRRDGVARTDTVSFLKSIMPRKPVAELSQRRGLQQAREDRGSTARSYRGTSRRPTIASRSQRASAAR